MTSETPSAAYQRRRSQTERRVTIWLKDSDAAMFAALCGEDSAQATIVRLIRDAARDKALDR